MIIKETGFNQDKWHPKINADGQKVYTAIAGVQTSALVPMDLSYSSSGMIVSAIAATGGRWCVCLEAKASGEFVDVAVGGYIKGVSGGASGMAATAQSTYTKGNIVIMNATGHLIDFGATFTAAYMTMTTANTTNAALVGIALSSGPTATLDIYWIEKFMYGACATA